MTTGNEYKKKYRDLQEKTLALEARIRHRLKELITRHPDAVIGTTSDNVQLKAKGLDNPYYLNNMSIDSTLQYIEVIERWLANQQPHQQLSIDYTDDPICNCDGRDMPIYEEDGKRWCPQCGYEVK